MFKNLIIVAIARMVHVGDFYIQKKITNAHNLEMPPNNKPHGFLLAVCAP